MEFSHCHSFLLLCAVNYRSTERLAEAQGYVLKLLCGLGSFCLQLLEIWLGEFLPNSESHGENKIISSILITDLESVEISWFEIIGRTAAPIHNVLVLAFASQLAVPVCDPQIVIHHGVAMRAVF